MNNELKASQKWWDINVVNEYFDGKKYTYFNGRYKETYDKLVSLEAKIECNDKLFKLRSISQSEYHDYAAELKSELAELVKELNLI